MEQKGFEVGEEGDHHRCSLALREFLVLCFVAHTISHPRFTAFFVG